MKSIYLYLQNKNLFFIFVFLFFLLLPNLHFSYSEISEKENRTLAKYIPLFSDGKFNWDFGVNFESFYNDRFFARDKFIALNNLIKQFFLSQTQENAMNARVMQGKDNWLFYRGDESESNFLNFKLFSNDQLEHGLQYLKDIKTWCDKNGKIFVFLIAPDKNKIYGEYFPDNYKKIRSDKESRTFQFINFIRKNSDISIVYPYEELFKEKSSGRLLYYKNDTHWNFDGAFIGYKALIEEIQKNINVDQIKTSDFIKIKNPKGDLNNLFPEMKFTPDELTIYYKPKIDSNYKNLTEGIAERTLFHTTCENKKNNAIFFRDSFCTALTEFTSNTFGEAVYYWRYNITKEDLIYIKENSDVVILECVERHLPNAISQNFPKYGD